MTWFKVDDGFHSHPKVLSIPEKESAGALRLWLIAGSWCASNLTDGHVPGYMIHHWRSSIRNVNALVGANLWVAKIGGGYVFHDWADYNPTKEVVEETRAVNRARQERHRKKPQVTVPDDVSSLTNDGVSHADVTRDMTGDESVSHATPTRPDPTRPLPDPKNKKPTTSRPGSADADRDTPGSRPDVDQLCEMLANDIENRGSKRPLITREWRTQCRLLIDADGRTPAQIKNMLEWLAGGADEQAFFWRKNVRGMPKLRIKYDQLREVRLAPPPNLTNSSRPAHADKTMANRERALANNPYRKAPSESPPPLQIGSGS